MINKTPIEVDYDEMIDAFVWCWTKVEERGHSGVKTTVGPYEIIVRRRGEVTDV